jgi:hypothetical protein
MPERSIRLSRLFAKYVIPLGFGLYILMNFLPVSGRLVNNFFYLVCALPAFVWAALNFRELPDLLRGYALLWLLMLGFLVSGLLHEPHLGIKPVFCVIALLLALHICWEQDQRTPRQLFVLLTLLGLVALAWGSLQWILLLQLTGVAPRFQLWGSLHPIRSALLIGCGLAWLWAFVLEPRLHCRSIWLQTLGFSAVILLMFWCAVIFQARSLLIGIICFIGFGLLTRRVSWQGLLASGMGLGLAGGLGWLNVLRERGLSYRQDIWEDGWSRLNSVCGLLQGCGEDGYKLLGKFDHLHSAYWSIIYVHGLPLFLLFVLCAAVLAIQGLRYRSRWLLVASIGWGGVLTTTGGVVHSPAEYWIYFWMPTLFALFECRQAKRAAQI